MVSEVIENIDIGGPSMVRSAAKNHESVAIVTDPADYVRLIAEVDEKNGTGDISTGCNTFLGKGQRRTVSIGTQYR
nr:hypothetical protein [Sphingobium sp.]